MDVDKYDEYVPRPEQEIITVETKIKSSNKGFAMLAKLGWVEGQPLGVSGEGNVASYSPGMAYLTFLQAE
jgi:Wiskott-Aldrich syndrome protein